MPQINLQSLLYILNSFRVSLLLGLEPVSDSSHRSWSSHLIAPSGSGAGAHSWTVGLQSGGPPSRTPSPIHFYLRPWIKIRRLRVVVLLPHPLSLSRTVAMAGSGQGTVASRQGRRSTGASASHLMHSCGRPRKSPRHLLPSLSELPWQRKDPRLSCR